MLPPLPVALALAMPEIFIMNSYPGRSYPDKFVRDSTHAITTWNPPLAESVPAGGSNRTHLGDIIGRSEKMQAVYELVFRAAKKKATTAIYGETGTGKELVARTIHNLGPFKDGPFIPVNCGAISDELFASEFFGYKKGAFTGAFRDKQGYLGAARNGTLFLDELGELSLSSQAKLLRVLGSEEYTPVGCQTVRKTHFRLVVATNRNLEEMVCQGTFRQDFYYRVHILPIDLPPLKDRKEDIPYLVNHFFNRPGHGQNMAGRDIAKLTRHDWTGNVRELQNVLERYIALGNLDFLKTDETRDAFPSKGNAPNQPLRDAVGRYEKGLIVKALQFFNQNRTKTASALGLPRKTLFRKMKKYQIN
jgi:transcriptional regulator with PAS, ATPase and Fis domain